MRKLGLTNGVMRHGTRCVIALLCVSCKSGPEPTTPSPAPEVAARPDPMPAQSAQPVEPGATVAPTPANPNTAPAAEAPVTPTAAGENVPTYDEKTKAIEAKVGIEFVVAVPENITTPMKWYMEPPPDAKVIAFVGKKYTDEPPPGCEGCTGYGGTRALTFRAKGEGKTILRLSYAPLGGLKGKPDHEVTIEITVK